MSTSAQWRIKPDHRNRLAVVTLREQDISCRYYGIHQLRALRPETNGRPFEGPGWF